ncbi:MAG: sulfotransferase, partial [Chitinophagaceae bacterium]
MLFDEPIFVLGNPRSGTTLLRLMLNAHADICIPPECGFIQWWFQKYQSWSTQNNNHEDVAAFISDLQTSKKIETWKLDDLLLAKIILENKPVDYAGLCAM